MGAAANPMPAEIELWQLTERDDPPQVTLLELVEAVGSVTHDDREVIATVLYMLRSRRVRLRGSFRNEPVENF